MEVCFDASIEDIGEVIFGRASVFVSFMLLKLIACCGNEVPHLCMTRCQGIQLAEPDVGTFPRLLNIDVDVRVDAETRPLSQCAVPSDEHPQLVALRPVPLQHFVGTVISGSLHEHP